MLSQVQLYRILLSLSIGLIGSMLVTTLAYLTYQAVMFVGIAPAVAMFILFTVMAFVVDLLTPAQ